MINFSLSKTKNTEKIVKELQERFGATISFDGKIFTDIEIRNEDYSAFFSSVFGYLRVFERTNVDNYMNIESEELDTIYVL